MLWEVYDGGLTRFRRRTGHSFSMYSVLAEQFEQIEDPMGRVEDAGRERQSVAPHSQPGTAEQPWMVGQTSRSESKGCGVTCCSVASGSS